MTPRTRCVASRKVLALDGNAASYEALVDALPDSMMDYGGWDTYFERLTAAQQLLTGLDVPPPLPANETIDSDTEEAHDDAEVAKEPVSKDA